MAYIIFVGGDCRQVRVVERLARKGALANLNVVSTTPLAGPGPGTRIWPPSSTKSPRRPPLSSRRTFQQSSDVPCAVWLASIVCPGMGSWHVARRVCSTPFKKQRTPLLENEEKSCPTKSITTLPLLHKRRGRWSPAPSAAQVSSFRTPWPPPSELSSPTRTAPP